MIYKLAPAVAKDNGNHLEIGTMAVADEVRGRGVVI
jgi:hypothetical protein